MQAEQILVAFLVPGILVQGPAIGQQRLLRAPELLQAVAAAGQSLDGGGMGAQHLLPDGQGLGPVFPFLVEGGQRLLQLHAVWVPLGEQQKVLPESLRIAAQLLQKQEGVLQDLQGFVDAIGELFQPLQILLPQVSLPLLDVLSRLEAKQPGLLHRLARGQVSQADAAPRLCQPVVGVGFGASPLFRLHESRLGLRRVPMLLVENAELGPGVGVAGLQFDKALELPHQGCGITLSFPKLDQEDLDLCIRRRQAAGLLQAGGGCFGVPPLQLEKGEVAKRGHGFRIQLHGTAKMLFRRLCTSLSVQLGSPVDQRGDPALPGIPGFRIQLLGPAEGLVGLFEAALLEGELSQTLVDDAQSGIAAVSLLQQLFGFLVSVQAQVAEAQEGLVEGIRPGFVDHGLQNPGGFLEHPLIVQLDGKSPIVLRLGKGRGGCCQKQDDHQAGSFNTHTPRAGRTGRD